MLILQNNNVEKLLTSEKKLYNKQTEILSFFEF